MTPEASSIVLQNFLIEATRSAAGGSHNTSRKAAYRTGSGTRGGSIPLAEEEDASGLRSEGGVDPDVDSRADPLPSSRGDDATASHDSPSRSRRRRRTSSARRPPPPTIAEIARGAAGKDPPGRHALSEPRRVRPPPPPPPPPTAASGTSLPLLRALPSPRIQAIRSARASRSSSRRRSDAREARTAIRASTSAAEEAEELEGGAAAAPEEADPGPVGEPEADGSAPTAAVVVVAATAGAGGRRTTVPPPPPSGGGAGATPSPVAMMEQGWIEGGYFPKQRLRSEPCNMRPPIVPFRPWIRGSRARPPSRPLSGPGRRAPPAARPPATTSSSLQHNGHLGVSAPSDGNGLHDLPESTGISYLDTWMGKSNRRGRGAPPSAMAPPRSKVDRSRVDPRATSLPPPTIAKNPARALSPSAQIDGLPSFNCQVFTLRPSEGDTPESLMGMIDRLVRDAEQKHVVGDQRTTIPLMLHMSSLDASTAKGTLIGFADAIRFHQGGESSTSQAVSKIGLSLVGVANLKDPSMADEACSLNLPIFTGNDQSSASTIFDGASVKPKRKRRGGVAPLLRQRRPGVAASNASVASEETSSTISTKDEAPKDEDAAEVRIVGTGKLPPHNSVRSSTKVHKGSVRSGQLLSSDLPNQSLVVIGSVNPGGEVWSEGDVYVFGKLRGRVLAGLSGVGGSDTGVSDRDGGTVGANGHAASSDRTAIGVDEDSRGQPQGSGNANPRSPSRIFATSFDPELVCIGDRFTTVDDVAETCGLDGVGPAMVTVDETTGDLLFERIDL
ncbi:hypothetical protein ACHAWF_017666 [Thalassiosira exigua]